MQSIVISMSVCVCVFVCERIIETSYPVFPNFVHVTYDHGMAWFSSGSAAVCTFDPSVCAQTRRWQGSGWSLISMIALCLACEMFAAEGLCTTKTCVTVASAILNAMDDAVHPCDDFYQFACGGWIKSNPIPASESRWNTFAVLRKQNEVVIKNVLGEREILLYRGWIAGMFSTDRVSGHAPAVGRVRPSVCLFPPWLLNGLAFDFDVLLTYGSWH